MIRYIFILYIFLGCALIQGNASVLTKNKSIVTFEKLEIPMQTDTIVQGTLHKKRRWVAAVFGITLGHFGVHRLYLGTTPLVPVLYTATIGGGIVLPFIDVVIILSTKDFESIQNNPNFFIWDKKR